MTRKIRVGMQFHPQHTTIESFLAGARRADEMGLDTLWDWDHFFPLYGNSDGPHFEAWTLLSAMAMATTRAEIGCLVTCNSYRNPALLSNMAKTVDHISGGRLILGIGAGWKERDYSEYGFDFGTPGTRLRALEKGLEIIKQRWELDVPRPLRNPIPILIGGGGERKTLRLVAQYADIWHSFSDPETHARKSQVLKGWCEQIGRNPDDIEHAVEVQSGSSEKDLDAYVEAGATHFILGGSDNPWNFYDMEWLARWRDKRNG